MRDVQIFSTGSCGSHFVLDRLTGVATDAGSQLIYDYLREGNGFAYKHQPQPPGELVLGGGVAVYVYGNPLNHAFCMYRNGKAVHHCEQMGGDAEALMEYAPNWEAYLAGGVDYFGWYSHVKQWLLTRSPFDRVLVKYEDLPSTWPALCEYLATPYTPSLRFNQRRTDYRQLPRTEQVMLAQMMGREIALYANLPPLVILPGMLTPTAY